MKSPQSSKKKRSQGSDANDVKAFRYDICAMLDEKCFLDVKSNYRVKKSQRKVDSLC